MGFKRADDCVLYFNVVKFHKEIFEDNLPVNVWQLMYVTGTEATSYVSPVNVPDVDLPEKYITQVKLSKFGVYHRGSIPASKSNYPWEKLIDSIEKEGIKKPILVERMKNTYRAFEGRHRLRALSLIKPFDKNRIVPCLLVDYNEEYSKKMFLQTHIHPFKSGGVYKSDRR